MEQIGKDMVCGVKKPVDYGGVRMAAVCPGLWWEIHAEFVSRSAPGSMSSGLI